MTNEQDNNEKKKITTLIILIVTVMISTTSATYAYFALSANNNNVITGQSAKVENELIVTKILPTQANQGTGVMVPQLSANTTNMTNALKLAIDGSCIDGNGNVACQVYKITFQNKSNATVNINSLITLTSTMTNLKWYTIKEGNNVASVPATPTYTYPASFTAKYGNAKAVTSLGATAKLDAQNYRYWYVVIWIEETGEDQYSNDGNKSFTGTIDIQSISATGNVIKGVTSTFTG